MDINEKITPDVKYIEGAIRLDAMAVFSDYTRSIPGNNLHNNDINPMFELTHLCQMEFLILIKWTSLYLLEGLLGCIFHFY